MILMLKIIRISIVTIIISGSILGQSLNLPSRPENAPTGNKLVRKIEGLSLENRDSIIASEILSGNVPAFVSQMVPINFKQKINEKKYSVTYFVTADYLAIGSSLDYLYTPMAPATAQRIADSLGCILPTKKIVNQIYESAAIRLHPQPINPSSIMTTVPVFLDHTDSIKYQLSQKNLARDKNPLIAGHKKDVIISNSIKNQPKNVVIYGWHKDIGKPIQPVYGGHYDDWVDYSHGIRLVKDEILLNGKTVKIQKILRDSTLGRLFCEERVLDKISY